MTKGSKQVLSDILKAVSLTALVAWFWGVSFVNYMLFILSLSNIFLLLIVLNNKNNGDIASNLGIQSDGQVSRIYDWTGNVVGTKYTEQIESGYWVSIITDDEWNLKAEHIRTFANIEKYKNERDSQEHKYNKNVVWGENYRKSEGLRFAEKMRRRNAMKKL